MYREIVRCRVCGNAGLDPILDLGLLALTGIFPKSVEQAVPVAPLLLVKCREDDENHGCGLVQLKHSCDTGAMYGANYGYRSGLNQSMVEHLRRKASAIRNLRPLKRGDLILDIGSNDGTFLKAIQVPDVELVGMDPTASKFREFYPPAVRVIPDFFSAQGFREIYGNRRAAVVTSIAMFYDVESPLDFMREVSEILSPDGIWVFEQSYLPTMLANKSYDTICHEHLEYYRLKQIHWMCSRVGLKILDVEFNSANGGSFSVTAARESGLFFVNDSRVGSVLREEEDRGYGTLPVYAHFRSRVLRHREELFCFLDHAVRSGERIIGYGASTKGNVLLQFCGVTRRELPLIAEVNADKFGAWTPGTLIPIVSEQEARAMEPDGLLVLPWHFRDNIISRESAFVSGGGKLIFPLPGLEVVDLTSRRNTNSE